MTYRRVATFELPELDEFINRSKIRCNNWEEAFELLSDFDNDELERFFDSDFTTQLLDDFGQEIYSH